MKRALLGTTALIGASLGATVPAAAESPIQLSVGGWRPASRNMVTL